MRTMRTMRCSARWCSSLNRWGAKSALITATEAEAWHLGFASLCTSTDVAESLLLRRGWQAVGTIEYLPGTITIYRLHTPS